MDGKHHSNEPLPLERAKKQLTALNIAHAKKKGSLKGGNGWAEIERQSRLRDVKSEIARFSQMPQTPQNKQTRVELLAEMLYLENEGVEDARRQGDSEVRSDDRDNVMKRYEKEISEGRRVVENPMRQAHRGEMSGESKTDEPARPPPQSQYGSSDSGVEECCKVLGVGTGKISKRRKGAEPIVKTPLKEMVKEHEELVETLKMGKPKAVKKELKKQMAELKKYKKASRGGARPDRSTLQKMAIETRKTSPVTSIDGFELIHSSPSIKFYKKENVIIVAVRGSQTLSDWTDANRRVIMNQLEASQRFKNDLKELQLVQQQFPMSENEYYGVGHSLGGAILDSFLQMGLIQSAVSYNPALQPKNAKNVDIQNERIYAENDPIYQIAKAVGLATKPEVRPAKRSMLGNVARFIPYAGPIYDYLQGHKLKQFEGGTRGGKKSNATNMNLSAFADNVLANPDKHSKKMLSGAGLIKHCEKYGDLRGGGEFLDMIMKLLGPSFRQFYYNMTRGDPNYQTPDERRTGVLNFFGQDDEAPVPAPKKKKRPVL